MNDVIKKAIEGGYDKVHLIKEDEPPYYKKGELNYMFVEDNNQIILDPLFWKSLGKACGWNGGYDSFNGVKHYNLDSWQYHALTFHEINLTESFEKAVEYLQKITT